MHVLTLWVWARRGFLPRGGGLYDQDNRTMELLSAVEGAAAEIRAEKR